MATKHDLGGWIVEALRDEGGAARLVDICRHVWNHHELELRQSGDLFFKWQYDIRWAATELRHAGILKSASDSQHGICELRS